jgi:hypothetical protein
VINSYLVVFGCDAQGKPRASRFTESDAALATKAAQALGYRTMQLADAELVNQLRPGDVFARGHAFIRPVSGGRFKRLLVAADTHADHAAGGRL